MRITVDLAGMPPPVQVAVQRLLDALTAVYPDVRPALERWHAAGISTWSFEICG